MIQVIIEKMWNWFPTSSGVNYNSALFCSFFTSHCTLLAVFMRNIRTYFHTSQTNVSAKLQSLVAEAAVHNKQQCSGVAYFSAFKAYTDTISM
jgi:hypothetical protein